MRLARRVPWVAALVLGTACLLPEVKDLTGGGDDGGSDATLDGTVEAAADGAPDVSSDATLDAPTDGGALHCSSVDATFCDDFDDPKIAFLGKWGSRFVDDGAVLSYDDAALSPPTSVAIDVAPFDAGAQLKAYANRDISGLSTRVRLRYAVYVDNLDSSGNTAVLGQLAIGAPNGTVYLRTIVSSKGAQLAAAVYPKAQAATFAQLGPLAAFTGSAWHAIEIVLDVGQSPAHGSFRLDGVPIIDDVIPNATFGAGACSLAAPVAYVNTPTLGWRLHVDDVELYRE